MEEGELEKSYELEKGKAEADARVRACEEGEQVAENARHAVCLFRDGVPSFWPNKADTRISTPRT